MKKLLKILASVFFVTGTFYIIGCTCNQQESESPTTDCENNSLVEGELPQPKNKQESKPELALQEAQPEAPKLLIAVNEEPKRDIVRLRVCKVLPSSSFGIGANRDTPQDLDFWYKDDNSWHSFFGSGEVVSYAGKASVIALCKKIEKEDGVADYSPMLSVNLVPSSKEMFVIVAPSDKSPKCCVVDASPKILPAGKIAIVNMSPSSVELQFGDELKKLSANEYSIFSEPSCKRTGRSVPISISINSSGQSEIVYKSRVSYPDDQRTVLIVYDVSTSKRTRLNVKVVQF